MEREVSLTRLPSLEVQYPHSGDITSVYSAFGGVAIYRRSAIDNCRGSFSGVWHAKDAIDSIGECEWVSHNECVRKHNGTIGLMSVKCREDCHRGKVVRNTMP